MKIIPKEFFESEPRFDEYIDNIGYCVNCGKLNREDVLDSRISELRLSGWLCLIAHGYVRIVDIECECGSTKGIHDMDVEEYRVWDISTSE